jgi:hypothetical protein
MNCLFKNLGIKRFAAKAKEVHREDAKYAKENCGQRRKEKRKEARLGFV